MKNKRTAMDVYRIDVVERFDQLRSEWEAAYEADPHATIFVSWPWLRGWMEAQPGKWLVLAARRDPASDPVAFLPLAQPVPHGRLATAGSPVADHTSFVCPPEVQREAIKAFADFVQHRLRWNRLWMVETMDPRFELFLERFSPARFGFRRTQNRCPYIPLPDRWEQYLKEYLSSNRRKQLRRFLRRIDENDQIRVTLAQAGDLEQRIETLLSMWFAHWGDQPSQRERLAVFRPVLRRCFEHDSLALYTMWDADTPVAARACFVDRRKRVASAYISGWDERYAKLSPGNALRAYSIRDAIQNGMRVYDFLRGAEGYKYDAFGATDRINTSVFVTRKGLRQALGRLIRRLPARAEPSPRARSGIGREHVPAVDGADA